MEAMLNREELQKESSLGTPRSPFRLDSAYFDDHNISNVRNRGYLYRDHPPTIAILDGAKRASQYIYIQLNVLWQAKSEENLDSLDSLSRTPRGQDNYAATRTGMYASWIGNLCLFAAKCVAYAMSGSYAVLASMIDSVVDILSQCLVAWSEWCNRHYNPSYPVGRSRLDNTSVLGATLIMVVSMCLFIRECIEALLEGLEQGILPTYDLGPFFVVVIVFATLVKTGLWLYCRRIAHLTPAMRALSEDHFNDIIMNIAALIFPLVAHYQRQVWWIDPAGGLVISAYILWRWHSVANEQVRFIVGEVAPDDFKSQVKSVAESHHSKIRLVQIVAYHSGQGFIVELEMLMEESATLKEANELAESLQLKIEDIDNVERVYVHVSHEKRDFYGGKVERCLMNRLRNKASAQEPNHVAISVIPLLRHQYTSLRNQPCE